MMIAICCLIILGTLSLAFMIHKSEQQAEARHDILLTEIQQVTVKVESLLDDYHELKLLPSLHLLSSQRTIDKPPAPLIDMFPTRKHEVTYAAKKTPLSPEDFDKLRSSY